MTCLIFWRAPRTIYYWEDFNCILENTDSTDGFNYSRALAELVHGLTLTETWQGHPARRVYTHYSMSGKTRIDQIYPTQELLARTLDIETVVAPFTDHLAVCLRISIALPIMRMGCGLWKMDSAIITENTCTEKMRTLWAQLQRQKGAFSDRTMWWDHLCKRKIRQLFQREQAERRREHRMMEKHLYEHIYDVLQQPGPNDKTLPPLNCLKLKIVRLHSIRLQKILEDKSDADRPVGEQPTIYHTLQMKRRRAERPTYRL